MAMNQIDDKDYAKFFPVVFEWFRKRVHGEGYPYNVLDLRNTTRKLIELKHAVSDNVIFRVIIKMTYEKPTKDRVPERNIPDLDELFNTKSENNFAAGMATQVCFIQVEAEGKPLMAMLYTYSPQDEKYHPFEV